jgi:nitroreductase
MDVFDVIQKRFSVRSYQDKPVEQEKLNIILEAAQSAPTACNLQSFKIIVAKTEGRRELLKKKYITKIGLQTLLMLLAFAQLKINAG